MSASSIGPAPASKATPSTRTAPSTRHKQRGVAVITAMLIVALAVLAVTGIMLRTQVQVRSVENQISLSQSRWLARGAIDWARIMLMADGRTNAYDHNSDPWAIPVAETRIADAEGNDDRAAYISGRISDEQGKYNLLNLVNDGVVDELELHRLQRLLTAVGLEPELAERVAQALRETQPSRSVNPRGEPVTRPASRLPWLLIDDLQNVPGMDADAIARLQPVITLLPRVDGVKTKVNANTAPAAVLHATIDSLSLSQAGALASDRDRVAFQQLSDVRGRPAGARLSDDELASLSVESRFFRVQGRIRYERAFLTVEALVFRELRGQSTRILWMRES
jgi:general secretion pathway protein K